MNDLQEMAKLAGVSAPEAVTESVDAEETVIDENIEQTEVDGSQNVAESNNYPMDDLHSIHDTLNALNQFIMRNMGGMKYGHDMVKQHAMAMDTKLTAIRDDHMKFMKKFEAECKKEKKQDM